MAEQLPFDDHFQTHFVNHLLRDAGFFTQVRDEITPDLFSALAAQQLVRLIMSFSDDGNACPGTLIFGVIDEFHTNGFLSLENKTSISAYTDGLFKYPLQNRNFLLKEFNRFVRHQRFKRNVLPAAEFVKKGKFDEAEKLMVEAFTFRPSKEVDLGIEFTPDPSLRVDRRLVEDDVRLYTLIPDLDSRVRGLKVGELAVWQSQRSSAGKSAALAFLARSFLIQQANVLIITLEMSEEDYEDRMDMCIAGARSNQLIDRELLRSRLMSLFKLAKGSLRIKQLPGKYTSVDDLRDYVLQLENITGFHPDVILVDYADELCQGKGSIAGNTFDVGKEVYSGLRGWAVQEGYRIWTGMQSNRAGMEATVADQEHSGESLAKAWIADLIISINRTAEEAEQGITRLHMVKDRRGASRYTITINTDFETMQFYKAPA